LLEEARVESFQLELKAGWDEHTKPAILRTICAFANDLLDHDGGYVILGVEDAGGSATLPPKGLPPESIEQVSKEILGQVKHWIKPGRTGARHRARRPRRAHRSGESEARATKRLPPRAEGTREVLAAQWSRRGDRW
jgi:hypothetical protein